ncbi:MAG: 4-hydroxythreonine-4-phosphate dehydrogenase PdxA [Erysipelotrichaceae bacterium]|nr:4-hydroxythreonine-4-phosphate dehydrogenase PdxA [Erysipelotrichaceae bacterium]
MKRLGITMGDAAGVGAEIILKILDPYLNEIVVYGSFYLLAYYSQRFSYNFSLKRIETPEQAEEDVLNIIDPGDLVLDDFRVGQLSALCGKNAYLYLEAAVKDAMDQKISAIVTCPLNKEALRLAGYSYDGHTEILSTLTGTKDYAMLLWSDRLKTLHVSTHVSLKEPSKNLV